MKRHGIAAGWVVGILVLGLSAGAVVPDPDHYESIAKRNVFQLKPMPQASKPEPPPVPVPKITLNGTTTILDPARALMTVQLPASEGKPARTQSLTLAAGQREGDIEVLHIDAPAGIVQVKASGMILTLDFQNQPNYPPVPPTPLTPGTGQPK